MPQKWYLQTNHSYTARVCTCQLHGQCLQKLFYLRLILLICCIGTSANTFDYENFLSCSTFHTLMTLKKNVVFINWSQIGWWNPLYCLHMQFQSCLSPIPFFAKHHMAHRLRTGSSSSSVQFVCCFVFVCLFVCLFCFVFYILQAIKDWRQEGCST